MNPIIYNKPVFNLNIFKDTAFFKVTKNGQEYNALFDGATEDEATFLVSDYENENELTVTPADIENDCADITPIIIDGNPTRKADTSKAKEIAARIYEEYAKLSLKVSEAESEDRHNERVMAVKALLESLLSLTDLKESHYGNDEEDDYEEGVIPDEPDYGTFD